MSDQGPTYLWEQVNKYYQATRKPIHVAVAYTADAAAASLTIASLLKASLIAYDVQPIATTEELRAMIASANLAQTYAQPSEDDPLVDEFFLLVGIGGAIPLREYFDFELRHVVIVLDACRPVHLSNLRDQDNARLFLWGAESIREEVDGFFRAQRQAAAQQRRRRRRRDAMRRRKRLRHQYGEEEGRAVNGGGGGGAEPFPGYDDAVDGNSSSSSSDEDSGIDDTDSDGDGDLSLSLSQSQERIDWTDPEELPPYLEVAYYACDGAGRSCALEAHDLAVLLNRYKDATLWHAAVGVCDLFRRGLIDYATYLVEMRPLHDAVTLQTSVRRGEGAVNEPEEEEEDPQSAAAASSASAYLRRRSSNAMELHNRDEEQLYLLRHSSLWSAIWHHPVTASVLRLHHAEDGEGVLRQLLARCGVAAKVAQQPWREVPQADKTEALRLVQTELRHVAESRAKFLTFPNEIRCVSRTSGFSTEVSTFDVCTLHEALLAAVPSTALMTLDANFAGDAATAQRVVAERLRRFHREQFWKAHAILDMDASAKEFAEAVQDAVSLQQAVAVATSALMQPGMLQSTAGLHYIIPSDPTRTTTALESFSTVYRLSALARRLLLTLTVERGLGRYTHAVRPLLLACAVPKPVREEADTSFASGFTPSTGTNTGGAALKEVSMNTLPFTPAETTASANNKSAPSANAQDMLFSAAGGGDGGMSAAVAGGEEHEFLIQLAHEGTGGGKGFFSASASSSAMAPIPSVGRFLACIHDPEEFDTPPQQRYVAQRTAVVVGDRASAAHLADVMYLSCLSSRWDPQREYLAAVAEAQEAQGPDPGNSSGDDGDDDADDGDNGGGDGGGAGPDDDLDGGADRDNGDDDDDADDEDRYFGEALNTRARQGNRVLDANAGDAATTAGEDEGSRGPISVS